MLIPKKNYKEIYSTMYKMLAQWCFEIIEFLQILKIIIEWELEMGPRRKRSESEARDEVGEDVEYCCSTTN